MLKDDIMKIINQGDVQIIKTTYKKTLDMEAEYRLSIFTYMYQSQGRYLIRNTLTLEVMELTDVEWSAVVAIKERPVNVQYLEDSGITELAKLGYLISVEKDEIKQYKKIIFLLKTMASAKKGIKSYIIFLTTACNARCFYCFEENFKTKSMSLDTADRLVDFILKTRSIEKDKPIHLRWFGGEPLIGASIIRRICTALSNHNVPYKSFMITNASLLTPEMAKEAKELWHLKNVQVSLDGSREDYELRKNYYLPEKYNYDTVMRAIHLFSEQGIHVRLRINVDFENIVRMPIFFSELKKEFGTMENIDVYLTALYQEREKEGFIDLYKKIYFLTDLLDEIGIPRTIRSEYDTNCFRMNMCMADAMNDNIVITTDGIFNNCEHLPESRTWGNIFDGVTDPDKEKELSAEPVIDPVCAKCAFLPECTPYYKTGCPGWFSKCYEYNCLKTEYKLDRLLKGVDMESDDYEEI